MREIVRVSGSIQDGRTPLDLLAETPISLMDHPTRPRTPDYEDYLETLVLQAADNATGHAVW
jgi:hypothetical protein